MCHRLELETPSFWLIMSKNIPKHYYLQHNQVPSKPAKSSNLTPSSFTPELEDPWPVNIQITWLIEKSEAVQVHFALDFEGMRDLEMDGKSLYDKKINIISWFTRYCARHIQKRWVQHKNRCRDNQLNLPLAPKIIILPWWGPELEHVLRSLNTIYFHSYTKIERPSITNSDIYIPRYDLWMIFIVMALGLCLNRP